MLRPGSQDSYISGKVNMPTAKSHAELVREVEPRIKAQSFFSARVAEAHILDRLREVSDSYSRGEFGLGEARNRLKDFLRAEGYDPHQGGMRNLASTGRLNLILKQNAAMAHSAAEWQRMHDPDAMKVYPYVRYHARSDSRTRSEHAHLDGRIFRKDDPFLSTHTPPWEFNCRCWLEEITDREAGKTPDLIQPPTPAEKVTVDSKSGFQFDPAHAFEKFDFNAIKDPGLRENAREGVEKILAEESPAQAPAVPAPSDPSDQSDPSDNSRKPEPVREPEVKTPIQEPEPAEKPAPVKEPEPVNALIREPEPNKPEPVREPEVKQPEKVSSPGNNQETHKEHLARRKEQLARTRENRFKREAELLGGAKAIEGKHTRQQDLKNANPFYIPRVGPYSDNCQRCIAAYEARRRGYDVRAKPYFEEDAISIGDGWTRPFKNAMTIDCSSNSGMESKTKILEAMKDMPDGARCGVKIMLTEHKGHVFIAEKVKVGEEVKIVFVDPQSNKKDASYYFSGATGKDISIMRLDNRKFNAMVEKCCDVGV